MMYFPSQLLAGFVILIRIFYWLTQNANIYRPISTIFGRLPTERLGRAHSAYYRYLFSGRRRTA